MAGVVDSFQIVKSFKEVSTREVEYYKIIWDQDLLDILNNKIKPLVEQAAKDKVKSSFVISGINKGKTLTEATGIDAAIFTADESLRKPSCALIRESYYGKMVSCCKSGIIKSYPNGR